MSFGNLFTSHKAAGTLRVLKTLILCEVTDKNGKVTDIFKT
jgi:hypothetical protein